MGAFLRDFAMAGNCGENPMNSFLNNVDKSSSQLDLWQRDFQNFEKHEQTPISHLPLGFQDGFQEHPTFEDYGDFEDVWDNSLRFNIPRDEFAEFEVNPLVHNILHDFLNFSASNKIMPPQSFPQNEVQLSNVEVNKIVERSGAIARHFCVNNQNYQLMSQQLGNLFRSLNIHVDPRVILQKYTQPIGDWEREFIHFNEPQYHDSSLDRQFDSVWENQRQRIQQANEWRDDYQKNWSNYRAPEITTEEEKIFENAFQSSSAWVNEYNQDEDQERAEEEAWFSKFIDPQRSSNNNNNWVNDYHGKSNSGIPWVDEFHNNVNDEFNNLTEKVSEIPFEKLQNSNFMKFVNQVKNKEVTLPDLQMKVMED